MRRVLHRAIDHLADSWHAPRQAGGDSLRAAAARLPLRPVRETRAPGLLREPAADGGDVRGEPRCGAGLPCETRTEHPTLSSFNLQ